MKHAAWNCAAFGMLAVLAAGCGRHPPLAAPQRAETNNVVALREALGGAAAESAATTAAAPAAEPSGWATLQGRFTISGTPPAPVALTVDKDQAVCAPGGKQIFSERLVVDSASGGLRDVIVYLTAPAKFPVGDPQWEHPDYAAAREGIVEFDQKNCVFLSHAFVMRSTQQCRVLNSDPVGHNTNISGGGRANPANFNVAANAYATYLPGGEAPEPFAVACNIHPWMSARMLVRDSPYFAVSKADGSFEIVNLPAGVPLEFRIWQEASGFLPGGSVNGKDEKWSRGRVTLTLQPDQTASLDVVVDAGAFSR